VSDEHRDRLDFLRQVVEELRPANERWPGLWTRLESLLNECDRLQNEHALLESAVRNYIVADERYQRRISTDELRRTLDGE